MSAPLVYGELDQQALDAQYNNRRRFPDYKERFNAWSELSVETRATLKGHLNVAFGPRPKEVIDIFPAEGEGAPVYVFVHGGYWYSLDKADCSYVAQGMRPHGVMTVVNNYDLGAHGWTWTRSCARTAKLSPGCTVTPRSTAATRIASTSAVTRPAAIWRA